MQCTPKIGNVPLPICEFGSTSAPENVEYSSVSALSDYIQSVKSWREKCWSEKRRSVRSEIRRRNAGGPVFWLIVIGSFA